LEYLGLHNKPKVAVHPGHKRMGPKEDEDDDDEPRHEMVVIGPIHCPVALPPK
jgi:hypothetical protein